MMVCGGANAHPFLTPEDIAAGNQWCCYGDAEYGPTGCTCWDPVYDLEQKPPVITAVSGTRRTRCVDCAFRADSPERADGMVLEALPNFMCHQGIRRPVAFVHPDGRRREVHDSADYQPPIIGGIPYRADGRPADECAGMAQVKRQRVRAIERRARDLIATAR